MSKAQISRLEALLDRVRTRAAEPRAPRSAGGLHGDRTGDAHVALSHRDTTQADIVLEVDIETTTQDTVLAVPVEEAPVPEATESRERLVAAEPVAAEPAVSERAPHHEPEPEPAPEIIATMEVVEEAPASSRRPVAPQPEERLAEMAFGSEEPQPARHTPPPESGRLPAAPPAPSLEFEGDITGVHEAARPAAPAPLVPEATVANLAPSDAVADMVGRARQPAPATFVAALDASIAL